MNLENEEREKYERVWREEPKYRRSNHSLKFWKTYRSHFPSAYLSVLDIGCGNGEFFQYLRHINYTAWGVDIADNCLNENVAREYFIRANLWDWYPDRTWDLGVCCDVMEHIPTEMVQKTLKCILPLCKTTMFRIATHDSKWDGIDLHLTKQNAEWWLNQLRAVPGNYTVDILPSDHVKHLNHCFRVHHGL